MKMTKTFQILCLCFGCNLLLHTAYADTYFFTQPAEADTTTTSDTASSQPVGNKTSLPSSSDTQDHFIQRYQISHS